MPHRDSVGAADPPPSGWTRRERLVLASLVAVLVALVAVRAETRRPDSSRNPRDLDVLVIHVGGLSLATHAAPLAELAPDVDFDPADMQLWANAFAQSTDPVRSARCALDGDLVRDLRATPPPTSLPVRLGARGWRTLLLDDGGDLARLVGDAFTDVSSVTDPEDVADALGAWWGTRGPDDAPRFAFVQLASGHEPLHSDTTEAHVLQERYRLRAQRIREIVRDIAAAANTDRRGQLVVLMGASGLETGEHPDAPDLPWDSQLRVPFLMGLRWADGLPPGTLDALVQSADLAPTILDVLDLRTDDEIDADGDARVGTSLEGHIHGWTKEPLHDALHLFGVDHLAVRTTRWKLIAPHDAALRPVAKGSRLYSLTEDPGEQRDLLGGAAMGPVASDLLHRLSDRFGEPQSESPEGTARAPVAPEDSATP